MNEGVLFYYQAFVVGDFLDRNVDTERVGFNFPKGDEEDEEDEEEAMARIFIYNGTIWTGNDAKTMQTALNAAGYTDYEDKALTVDGKWGRRSQSAFDKMLAAHAPTTAELPDEATVVVTVGDKSYKGTVI